MSAFPTPSVKFRGWFAPADPVELVPGEDGFAPLVPIVEPLAAGAVPYPCKLIPGVGVAFPVREARARSGHRQTSSMETGQRPTCSVAWNHRTKAQRDELVAFLRGECGDGLLAFQVRVDGGDEALVKLRALAPCVDTYEDPAGTAGGLWTVEVECEQVV